MRPNFYFTLFAALFAFHSASAQCGGETFQYGHVGFYQDGSGADNYTNGMNCSWLFESGINGQVRLGFYDFDTESYYDAVRIYDGTDANAPLIAELSGNDVVGQIFYTTGRYAYVTWTTDASVTYPGFSAWWDSYNASFSDCNNAFGVAGDDYTNDVTYNWSIQPEGADFVRLNIFSINMESCCDFVRVYDGNNTSAPLIGEYTGNDPVDDIIAESGSMFVQFTSDYSVNYDGFAAEYSCGYCSGQTELTAASGTITDGSGEQSYINNTDCSWLIDVPQALSIDLDFTFLDLEQNYDYVTIYDGSNTSAPVLESVSGSELPPTISSSTGTVLVRFTTDGSVIYQGFELDYSSVTTGIAEESQNLDAKIYPNPTQDNVYVEVEGNNHAGLRIAVYDQQGRLLIDEQNMRAAKQTIDLSALASGTYIVRVSNEFGAARSLPVFKVN